MAIVKLTKTNGEEIVGELIEKNPVGVAKGSKTIRVATPKVRRIYNDSHSEVIEELMTNGEPKCRYRSHAFYTKVVGKVKMMVFHPSVIQSLEVL